MIQKNSLRVLIFGDIFGRLGRKLVERNIEDLKNQYAPDFILGNSENMTDGEAATPKHIHEFQAMGFDCLTGGNHSLSKTLEIQEELNREDTIQLRPANYYESPKYPIPGKGYKSIQKNGKTILIINLMSSVFMRDDVFNPFLKADEILAKFADTKFDAILVDFHRESTAESYCMTEYLSGRTSFVYGTHTHVQTNDEHILPSGTGMICDVGMTGPLHSSIGNVFSGHLPGYLTGVRMFNEKAEVLKNGPGSLHAVLVTIENGKCTEIEKIRIRDTI